MKKFYHLSLHLLLVLIACSGFHHLLPAQDWETLADIPEGLTFPVVTVLDGRIHVMGGGGSSGATDSHYAYDPATDTWETLSPVPYLAQQPAGCTAGGKIHYFGGGYPNSGTPLADHYVYDPGTDSWTQSTDLTAPRAIHYGAGIGDTAYTMAGQGMTTLFEAFNPVTEEWETRASLPDGFFMYSARCVANNKIFRFAGGGYSAPKNDASMYDPVLNEWMALPDFPLAIHGMEGAAIGDSIYLTGGYYDAYTTNEVWIYDIAAQEYSEGPAMPIERDYHSAVSLNGCIYVVGGYHPIFPDSVKVSLIRFCPYGLVGTEEHTQSPFTDITFRTERGRVVIAFPADFPAGRTEIRAFDLLGRKVYSATVHDVRGTDFGFNLPGRDNQVYLIKLTTGKEQFVKKLFIVQ